MICPPRTLSRAAFVLLVLAAQAMQAGAQTASSAIPDVATRGLSHLSAASIAAMGPSPVSKGETARAAAGEPLSLSLHDAIQRGLAHNLAAMLSEQRARAADGGAWTARSRLLPNVSASLVQAKEKINLEAFGFPVPPGESPLIGPFDISDRRLAVTQEIFNYSSIESARSAGALKAAADFGNRDVREQVTIAVSGLYLQVVSARSRIDAARAQLETAIALESRAAALKQAGMAAGVEIIRSQVQTEQQRQRVIFFENEFAKQKLQLARAIGLPLGQAFDLSDTFPYRSLEHLSAAEAIERALATRADYRGALQLVRAAEFSRMAAVGSLFPSIGFAADVGMIGPGWGSALRTYSVAFAVQIPLFQGGRERGRIVSADAVLQQERAQLADVKARVEYDVRAALLDVDSTDQRVKVAQRASDLAALQLTQAQDRFSAGVATHIEVVQAQEAVATASENLIASQYAHNLAKGALARALGVAESSAERFLGGQQ